MKKVYLILLAAIVFLLVLKYVLAKENFTTECEKSETPEVTGGQAGCRTSQGNWRPIITGYNDRKLA